MAVPYTFGAATAAIPLSQLDSNFASTITLGNTAIQLGNTVTILNNMTFANVTVSSGTVSVTTATATTANLVTINATTLNAATHRSDASLVLQTNGTTTAVTIDTAQNVGVGVTPSAWNTTSYRVLEFPYGVSLFGQTDSASAILATNGFLNSSYQWIYKTTAAATYYQQTTGQHRWYNAPSGTAGNTITFTQAMTLSNTACDLSLGNSTPGIPAQTGINFHGNTTNIGAYMDMWHPNGTSSGQPYIQFWYNGATAIGSITQNGTTGVLYNLTSDYRLKNNQEALTGAKDFIMALKPKKWQWWDGSGEGVGFVAHEFMEVAKYSGHGEKDAVDEEGNPVYQSIQPSSSEVMANLVSLIQEQQALIQSLTDRLTALEGAAK